MLLYKAQGEKDPKYPQIPAGGFILGIQTHTQKEFYEKFGILCIVNLMELKAQMLMVFC